MIAEDFDRNNVTSANASWNSSVEQLLEERLGPRCKDMVSAVLLTIVYCLIFLSGSLGNVCTCIVIVRNQCMQTTTNFYLFSLAMSDLLLLFFGLPPELFAIWMAYPWQFGEAFCYIRHTVLELTSYCSVLTITAFTVERYIAVCRPLLSHKIAVLSRAVKIIVCIWIVSILVALPYAVHTRLHYFVTWPPTGEPLADSLVCSIPEKWLEKRMTYMFQISTFLFFLAPVTLIICLYILIGIAIRRSALARASSEEQSQLQHTKHISLPHQPRRVVIRMLVAVTVAFIICWAPFHTQRLMVLYVQNWTPELLAAQGHIFYISGVLYFVSSTVNPILYNVISRRYRLAFKRTIFGPCCRDSHSRHSQHHHHHHQHGQTSNNANNRNNNSGRGKTADPTLSAQRHTLLDRRPGPRKSRGLGARTLSDSGSGDMGKKKRLPRGDTETLQSLKQEDIKHAAPSNEERAEEAAGEASSRCRKRRDSRAKHLAHTLCPLTCPQKSAGRATTKHNNSARRRKRTSSFEDSEKQNCHYCLMSARKTNHQTEKINAANNLHNVCNANDKTRSSPHADLNFIHNSHEENISLRTCEKQKQKYVIVSILNEHGGQTSSVDSQPIAKESVESNTDDNKISTAGKYHHPVSPRSSHQESVAKVSSPSSTSLCKQCLTNSPLANSHAPFTAVNTHRVAYDATQPHTIV